MQRLVLRVAISIFAFLAGITATNIWNWLKGEDGPIVKVEVAKPIVTDDERELLEIFGRYGAAQTKHDRAFFEEVEADDFMLFSDDEKPQTRSEDIEWMMNSSSDVVYTLDVQEMQIYGDVAVVHTRMSATEAGVTDTWSSIDVCMKREGRWQILSTTQF